MTSSNAKDDPTPAQSETGTSEERRKMAILGLFRLLETNVQTTQLKVGGQVVVRAQEIVGMIMSAKSDFEARDPKALQDLAQAAESFRHKVVRWEAEARAAQGGQRQLTHTQKRQLAAEIPAVRAASRKTHIFFERLQTEIMKWAQTVAPETPSTETQGAVEDTAKKDSLYQRGHVAFDPTDDVEHEVSASEEGLTMMTMMVQQQFEELDKLFRKAQYREIEQAIQDAWGAFNEHHYPTARTRLGEAHEEFLQVASTRKVAQAEIAEERFETLFHGIRKISEATKQRTEELPLQLGIVIEPKAAATPVEDLKRLQQLMQDRFDEMFPAGSAREHSSDAKEHMDLIISGPVADLLEHLRSLRHAITSGADNEAAETKEAREILKRLVKRKPEEIRPPLDSVTRSSGFPLIAEPDTDDDGITLDFALTSTKLFTVDAVDVRMASQLELEFRNLSTDAVRLHVQLYNAAGEPVLNAPEVLQLHATKEAFIPGHIGMAEKINPQVADAHTVTVEFTNVPDDVEISGIAFRRSDANEDIS